MEEVREIDVNKTNFHPILKDIENMFWLFLLSFRALADPEIQSLLKYKNDKQEGYQSFNSMLEKINNAINLKIERKKDCFNTQMNILEEMVFMGKAMSILTYDFLSNSKYNNQINRDNDFQFLRHIRNGAAHSNKFNLKDEKGNWKIEETEAIEWNGKKINRKIQGKEVFNGFISVFEIFLLVEDFSNKLKEIDKR